MGISKEIVKKICLLGDPAVGKTSLIRKYVFDTFDDKYIMTIGTKVTKKEIIFKKPELDMDIKLSLMIWDILGQKEYKRLHPIYYQGAEGAFIVSDYTRHETLEAMAEWSSSLIKVVGDVPMVYLVNKADLQDKAAFTEADVKAAAETFGYGHFFVSAKTGMNVMSAFDSLAKSLMDKFLIDYQKKKN
jgi:small GTP-binding protein